MVSPLDRLHARVLLSEMLRDVAPPVTTWSDQLLEDAHLLALELAYVIDQESAARTARREPPMD